MKKYLVWVLALIYLCSCTALAENVDLFGEWYSELSGMPMTLTLSEDYTYELNVDAGDTGTLFAEFGAWEYDDSIITFTANDDLGDFRLLDENAAHYTAETITAVSHGFDIVFKREQPQFFAPADANADAKLEDYSGRWSASRLAALGMTIDAAQMGLEFTIVVDEGKVSLAGGNDLFGLNVLEFDCAFEEGILIAQSVESVNGGGLNFTLRLLQDDVLEMHGENAETGEDEGTLYMVRAD